MYTADGVQTPIKSIQSNFVGRSMYVAEFECEDYTQASTNNVARSIGLELCLLKMPRRTVQSHCSESSEVEDALAGLVVGELFKSPIDFNGLAEAMHCAYTETLGTITPKPRTRQSSDDKKRAATMKAQFHAVYRRADASMSDLMFNTMCAAFRTVEQSQNSEHVDFGIKSFIKLALLDKYRGKNPIYDSHSPITASVPNSKHSIPAREGEPEPELDVDSSGCPFFDPSKLVDPAPNTPLDQKPSLDGLEMDLVSLKLSFHAVQQTLCMDKLDAIGASFSELLKSPVFKDSESRKLGVPLRFLPLTLSRPQLYANPIGAYNFYIHSLAPSFHPPPSAFEISRPPRLPFDQRIFRLRDSAIDLWLCSGGQVHRARIRIYSDSGFRIPLKPLVVSKSKSKPRPTFKLEIDLETPTGRPAARDYYVLVNAWYERAMSASYTRALQASSLSGVSSFELAGVWSADFSEDFGGGHWRTRGLRSSIDLDGDERTNERRIPY
ncbi:hypothetical protein SCHPADRAFT_926345 [Schizopora paradoxa]|uniref:Uncharacterized protein n=1 Tax=Schizopora paradoxa TaxID=27342 RepID=A0A0H2SI63_9AGAM|nr:hypothetical protein SCHPADRAFT_926345 [Schizopora paradoxa]